MNDQPGEALEVLRGVWSAQEQTAADLDDCGDTKGCKRMADVGFGGMAGPTRTCAPRGGTGWPVRAS